jgi:hypothetical protein
MIFCCESTRKSVIEHRTEWNGIDYLHVVDDPAAPLAERQTSLLVYFINELTPTLLSAANVRITGGERIRDIPIVGVDLRPTLVPPGAAPGTPAMLQPKVMRVKVAAPGDFSFYELRLVDPANESKPPAQIDRVLAAVAFTFKAGCTADFDCADNITCATEPARTPALNYLARDYNSFRQLMLDRLAVTTPGWTERNAADTGMALVELLAYVADRLAYQQDAVATEAYLGTARLRSSVRRHARLIDYPMHDGCNARTLVQLRAAPGVSGLEVQREFVQDGIPRPTQVLTRSPGLAQRVFTLGSKAHRDALQSGVQVFELLHSVTLDAAHNDMRIYTWGARECCLPQGATRATLRGSFPGLKAGDVLVFVEARSPTTGAAQDADTAHRHAVKLTRVDATEEDTIGGQFDDPQHADPVPLTDIEWHVRDALPFALTLSVRQGTHYFGDVTLAHGNIVAVDHGMTQPAVPLPLVPAGKPVLARVATRRAQACATAAGNVDDAGQALCTTTPYARYRPSLPGRPITQAPPFAHGPTTAACDELSPAAGQALAQVWLAQAGASDAWLPRRDLMASDGLDRGFVVEVEQNGYSYLRFGDDEFGCRPKAGTAFSATYRTDNGTAGNVGAGVTAAESSLFHLASVQPELAAGESDPPIVAVWNPLPARGGVNPETIESVRQRAPSAIRGDLQRAVTSADYEALARRINPSVQRAAATQRWTGSWRTVFLSVDRYGAQAVEQAFEDDLIAGLEPYRLAGQDLEIDEPIYVPLQLALDVCVKPEYNRGKVESALKALLSSGGLPDGRRGVFHPDNFSFGQTVYLSPIQSAALSVPGVSSIVVQSFQRQDQPETDGAADGCLRFARREIARLDSDRNHPNRGALVLNMKGGR